jgi:hypothetical protein
MGSILYGQASAIQAQGQVNAKRTATKSGNELRVAKTDLQLFSQALGNRKIMDAAGKNINSYGENIAKNLEGAAMGAFQEQLRSAEELGASTAMASAAGVGGSSVEAYNATLATSNGLRLEQSNRQFDRDIYAAGQARGDILTSAVDSLDKNVYRADLDVSTYMDVKKPSFLSGALTLGLASAATYFGGPQAGQAVIGFRESQIAAERGDYAQASSSFTGSLMAGVGAFKTYRQTGGNLWSSKKAGANLKG